MTCPESARASSVLVGIGWARAPPPAVAESVSAAASERLSFGNIVGLLFLPGMVRRTDSCVKQPARQPDRRRGKSPQRVSTPASQSSASSARHFAGRHRDPDLAPDGNEIVAAILPPGSLIVPARPRTLLAVADCGDAPRVQPEVLEMVPGRIGTPLSERQVVLPRAALVAVPFDADVLVGPLPRPRRGSGPTRTSA